MPDVRAQTFYNNATNAAMFKDIAVGAKFWWGGNIMRKRSTRTAEIISPARFQGTWFYMPMRERHPVNGE